MRLTLSSFCFLFADGATARTSFLPTFASWIPDSLGKHTLYCLFLIARTWFLPCLCNLPQILIADNTHCIFLQAHPREDEWEHMDTNIRRYGSNMASDTRREATHPRLEGVRWGTWPSNRRHCHLQTQRFHGLSRHSLWSELLWHPVHISQLNGRSPWPPEQ